jgi:hypothetical protein
MTTDEHRILELSRLIEREKNLENALALAAELAALLELQMRARQRQ